MNDKFQHALAGTVAALFGALLYVLIALALSAFSIKVPLLGIIPVPFIAALVAGVTKEAADWFDNRTTPGSHSVDPWDVAATAAPGLVISVVIAFAVL